MIHDILVHVPTERVARPVVDASVWLTADSAHIWMQLRSAMYQPAPAYVMDGGAAAIVATVFEEMERERASQRAAAALEMFEIEARTAGISYQSRASGELPGDAAASIGTAALFAVVLQPDTAQDTFDNTVPREILFQSGWTLLFVPHIFRGTFKAKRIGVCSDGCPAGRPRIERCATVSSERLLDPELFHSRFKRRGLDI